MGATASRLSGLPGRVSGRVSRRRARLDPSQLRSSAFLSGSPGAAAREKCRSATVDRDPVYVMLREVYGVPSDEDLRAYLRGYTKSMAAEDLAACRAGRALPHAREVALFHEMAPGVKDVRHKAHLLASISKTSNIGLKDARKVVADSRERRKLPKAPSRAPVVDSLGFLSPAPHVYAGPSSGRASGSKQRARQSGQRSGQRRGRASARASARRS